MMTGGNGRRAGHAFLHALRSVIDPGGQRVSVRDGLYLAADIPTLMVWGARDRVIPFAHGRRAHQEIPESRFAEIPTRATSRCSTRHANWSKEHTDFITITEPALLDAESLRHRLLTGSGSRLSD